MITNRGVEQQNQLDKMQTGGSSANDLDVIELFKQERQRKTQVQEHNDEAGSGAAAKRQATSTLQYEQKRKNDPQLRAIEHFANLAGRALPEFSDAKSAANGLESLLNRVSAMNKMLPPVDLIEKSQTKPS